MSRALCLLGAALSFWGVARFCRSATDGFTFLKVAEAVEAKDPAWAHPEIAGQTFTYLGRGKQCFVFASEDGKTVLKLMRKADRNKHERASYQLAFNELRAETGLIAVHLEKTAPIPATLVDKLHIAHKVNLGDLGFLVQKRATLVFPTLTALKRQGDIAGARLAVKRLRQLLENRRAKGIWDRDSNVSKNFGFVEGEPIQIDVGRFSKLEGESGFKGEELTEWIRIHYPELEGTIENGAKEEE